MNSMFSDRISDVPRSFIREILKVAIDPSVISFAGGLPNRNLFPVEELRAASNKVFESAGREALQYANSEGDAKLRESVSARYRERQGLEIPAENILITSGSQQGLDLLGKIFLNEGDDVIIEEPGYLGAIQAFSVYRAVFNPVPLTESGLDIERLKQVLSIKSTKLIYTVPNFQNPTGITCPEANRQAIAEVMRGRNVLLIEDDPYRELRFTGTPKESFYKTRPENTVLLGSFSKIIAPGLRIGWIAASDRIMEKLIVAKQASDLHTNHLTQRVLYQYLTDNDLDAHIKSIIRVYDRQRLAMLRCIKEYLPPDVAHTNPEGGMFLWLTLPDGVSSMDLFNLAIQDKVAFVPGNPFYVDARKANTLRLNFSCVDEDAIQSGMKRLGRSARKLLDRNLA
ncbi:MAG: PLP-dependent aminotransferase family protein [Nitrospirae bacterium]|nr:PLP-dependent aminotransferase family protein [Nitrospirota bacterium]